MRIRTRLSFYLDFLFDQNDTDFDSDFDLNPLAGLADLLENSDIFPYQDIPGFPVSTVPGHQSRLLFGLLKDIPVMLMQGRFHSYEGYPLGLVSTIVAKR